MTAIDAAQQIVAAIVYLAVAVAAMGQAPRDRRVQVFFGFSLANAVTFAVAVFGWFMGVTNPLEMSRGFYAITLSALGVGALLLFHFSQIFPSRRPWIKTSGIQMPVAYVLTPAIVSALALFWPRGDGQITVGFVVALLVFGFPLIVLLGIVLPVAAVMSFVRSYRDAGVPIGRNARPALGGILLSQVAGGVLAIVFAPVLAVVAPESYVVKLLGLMMWGLTLLTPLAFAAGVWMYKVLEIDPG
jgi:hypothetical protein